MFSYTGSEGSRLVYPCLGSRRPLVSVRYRSRQCQTTFRLAHSKKSGLLGAVIVCLLVDSEEECPSAVACSCAC